MNTSFFDIEGLIIPPTALKLRRAVELVAALSSDALPFASPVECRAKDGLETVVFEVRVERPQERQYDIRETERLAATFEPSDHTWPEVIALRRDFPLVPHLNLRENELPRSLCLYEDSWDRVRLTWSPPSFIEWIRRWLALTVRDKLHAEDQALQPLMFSSGYRLILPVGLELENFPDSTVLRVTAPGGVDGRVLCADPATAGQKAEHEVKFTGFSIRTPPRAHGVSRRAPRMFDGARPHISM